MTVTFPKTPIIMAMNLNISDGRRMLIGRDTESAKVLFAVVSLNGFANVVCMLSRLANTACRPTWNKFQVFKLIKFYHSVGIVHIYSVHLLIPIF